MTPNIEDITGGKEFESAYEKLRVNIVYTENWLCDRVRTFLKPFDITQQQFNILQILRGEHPGFLYTKEITERMIYKMSDTSRLVDRLEEKELVVKEPCDTDARRVKTSISKKGLSLLKNIDREKAELDKIVSNITEEEAETLNGLLDKLHQ